MNERQRFLEIKDIEYLAPLDYFGHGIMFSSSSSNGLWEDLTKVKFKIGITNKFSNLFQKPLPNIDTTTKPAETIRTAEAMKPAKVNYEYDEHSERGTLQIGNLSEIVFNDDRAEIINFFYNSKAIEAQYINYHDFNKHLASRKETFNSDEFSKAIKAINKRVATESKNIIAELIISNKNKSKPNDLNSYKFI